MSERVDLETTGLLDGLEGKARAEPRYPASARYAVARQHDPVVRWQRIHCGHPTVGIHRQCGLADPGKDGSGHGAEPIQRAVVGLAQLRLRQPGH